MLARLLAWRGAGTGVEVAIGDDAAVLTSPLGGERIVFTIDEQVEGVHFRRDIASYEDIGWRSLMAAASDVAAMGARPWCALCALVLPDDVDDSALAEIAAGQREAARAVGAPIVGGNLSRGPALSIATTFLGTCREAVTRAGARAGDGLWLAGRVGLAAAGFDALTRGVSGREGLSILTEATAAWRRPRALVDEGVAMQGVAHAAIDVSDGLARDVDHLVVASGVCAVLDEPALLADETLVASAAALGRIAIDLALEGGEDYALVAASAAPLSGFRRIGEVRSGAGVFVRGVAGERRIDPRGFDHFRRPPGA
jgi:thiamine-monophosphate kinase